MTHADPEVAQAYNRRYKQQNRWRYRRRQKAYDAARHANEKAARLGVAGEITADDAQALLEAGRCGHCGQPAGYFALELDHIIPFSAVGCTNTIDNIIGSCESCNARKATKQEPGAWSRDAEACRECGLTERPHAAKGLCTRCNDRRTYRARRTP